MRRDPAARAMVMLPKLSVAVMTCDPEGDCGRETLLLPNDVCAWSR